MAELRTCERCGHVGHDVRARLVRYPETVHDGYGRATIRYAFATEDRCVDRAACESRPEVPA
jgi:hypothetical protein